MREGETCPPRGQRPFVLRFRLRVEPAGRLSCGRGAGRRFGVPAKAGWFDLQHGEALIQYAIESGVRCVGRYGAVPHDCLCQSNGRSLSFLQCLRDEPVTWLVGGASRQEREHNDQYRDNSDDRASSFLCCVLEHKKTPFRLFREPKGRHCPLPELGKRTALSSLPSFINMLGRLYQRSEPGVNTRVRAGHH
jgi:hypothetical protein